MKKGFFLFALSLILFSCSLHADQIHLTDGRVLYGRVIDKTPTKYIIEKVQEKTGITEIVEIDIAFVSVILEDKDYPLDTTEDTEITTHNDPKSKKQDKNVISPGKDSKLKTKAESVLETIKTYRQQANDWIAPYIDKAAGERESQFLDFLKLHAVDILLFVFIVIVLLFFGGKSTKMPLLKDKKKYISQRLPGLDIKPLKDKKLFKNMIYPNVSLFYQITQGALSYQESVCKVIDINGASIITNEALSEGLTLKLILIREKRIGRNVIKEDMHLNADVKSVKEAPVKNYYEHYLSFHHLFLSQRAFINKILSQENP